jgi:hypothetical protein
LYDEDGDNVLTANEVKKLLSTTVTSMNSLRKV